MDVREEDATGTIRRIGLGLGKYYPTIILASASLFFAYDIIADVWDDSDSVLHIAIESLVFLAVSTVLFGELRRVKNLQTVVSTEQSKTARLSGELLVVMRNQFARWGLSRSESEVALLLIKGLSMREISHVRQVKEKTVRQQATSIYAKSGYAGRHELVAHFIEDLMGNDAG